MVDLELAEGASLHGHRRREASCKRLEAEAGQAQGRHRELRRLRRHRFAAFLPAAATRSCRRRTSPSSCCCARTSNRARTSAQWLIDTLARDFPDLQGARDAPGERAAGGLSRSSSACPASTSTTCGASPTRSPRRCAPIRNVDNVNLDWDEPSKVVRLHIDQERARALGVSSAQVSLVPQRLAVRHHGQHLSRRQRADRDPAARPGRGARAPGTARQPGGADRERPQRAAVADRHARIRVRGRHHLASQPPADDHRARRHLRRCHAADGDRADPADAGRHPRRAAARLPARNRRHRRGFRPRRRSRSPPACRCSCWR